MNTKDLIKRMSKSQDVKPAQLIKQPKPVEIEMVQQEELESTEECIERKVQEMTIPPTKEEALKKQLDEICESLMAITKRCSEIQDALELLLAEHTVITERLEKVEARLFILENKPSIWQRIFKWRS